MSANEASKLAVFEGKRWVQIVRTLSIPTEGGPQKLNCANTGQLYLEPSEKIGRLKTAGGDDRTFSANFGKAPKGGGQFVPSLAFEFATEREG
jgi:hypothetical protein